MNYPPNGGTCPTAGGLSNYFIVESYSYSTRNALRLYHNSTHHLNCRIGTLANWQIVSLAHWHIGILAHYQFILPSHQKNRALHPYLQNLILYFSLGNGKVLFNYTYLNHLIAMQCPITVVYGSIRISLKSNRFYYNAMQRVVQILLSIHYFCLLHIFGQANRAFVCSHWWMSIKKR